MLNNSPFFYQTQANSSTNLQKNIILTLWALLLFLLIRWIDRHRP